MGRPHMYSVYVVSFLSIHGHRRCTWSLTRLCTDRLTVFMFVSQLSDENYSGHLLTSSSVLCVHVGLDDWNKATSLHREQCGDEGQSTMSAGMQRQCLAR